MSCFYLMLQPPPRPTRPDTLFPYTTLVRSAPAGGSILLFGGWTRTGVTDLVERYAPETGRFEAQGRMLEPRDGFSATLLADGTILIVGGYGEGMRRLASAERYDPASGRLRSAGLMSEPRTSHTDRKGTHMNSSHQCAARIPYFA